jgi:hypothetical protein
VDGAGTDDNEETAEGVGVLDNGDAFFTAGQDGVFGLWGLEDFVLKEVGWSEGVVALDCRWWCLVKDTRSGGDGVVAKSV